ncbi:hypothetical protein [Nonomuraea sp. NPDC050783]|uniref:hypothetical protein n=1 Tax=Nonomuraea sp. NPDC050783 TaxID=3154634 RepID=UPI0034652D10
MLGEYAAALERAPLSAETRRTYRSRVRMFLSWLADHAATYSTDPLADRQAWDWAVRDYRMWLLRDAPPSAAASTSTSPSPHWTTSTSAEAWARPTSPAKTCPKAQPRALEERARVRWLRAVGAHLPPRGRCIALIPYYAGARISKVVRLDVGDVQLSARKGRLRLYGTGGKFREVDIHPSSAASCGSGWMNAPTGPAPATTQPCSSTPRAGG